MRKQLDGEMIVKFSEKVYSFFGKIELSNDIQSVVESFKVGLLSPVFDVLRYCKHV